MKKNTSIAAVVAIAVAALVVQPALAESPAPDNARGDTQMQRGHGPMAMWHRGQGRERTARVVRPAGAGLLALTCTTRGAQRLERLFDRVQTHLALTNDQEPLFDEFRSTALTAQTAFADSCSAARGALREGGPGLPLPERLKLRLELDQARVGALGDVFPAFEAFYDTLTDEQKAKLEPRRSRMRGMHRRAH